MCAYSRDLRNKIVEAYESEEYTQREISELFGVSLSFLEKLLKRWRTTGSIEAKAFAGGRRSSLDEDAREFVRRCLKENQDATLEELCAKVFEDKGMLISVATMWRVTKQLGLPLKKRHSSPQKEKAKESNRPAPHTAK